MDESHKRIDLLIKYNELLRSQAELLLVTRQLLPSNQLPVMVQREGSRWSCSLMFSENPLDNVIAYGEYPQQAVDNFNNLWLGKGLDLSQFAESDEDEDEEDYEEQF